MHTDDLVRVSLCHTSQCCPEVVVDRAKGEVQIGEDGTYVTLDRQSWNELIERIRSGELAKL